MQTQPAHRCIKTCKGNLEDAIPQTGNNGEQQLLTVAEEKETKLFYMNTLYKIGKGMPITIQFLDGEAPRFKQIQTTNPAWTAYNGRMPFFINEHYTIQEYCPKGVITMLVPLNGKIPFALKITGAQETLFQDNEQCKRYGLML